ncbi:MAG TPA: 4-hydroxy-tetrahydrodipicolinate synthase [Saprospiraceae bacterium]|nr:4-hydroxy-tetrahydrodipicolinate synthase [Saprospiraceae bacterium]
MAFFDPTGTGVALITPFRNGKIDFDALTRMIEHVIHGRVEYIVSLGTTGEATSLSDEEQQQVLAHTIKTVAGRVPIVAGQFGGNNTALQCEKLKAFDPAGVAAILSSSPAYVKPSQEGIYQHYMALVEASPLPMIIYNVPSRTASNITANTLIRLANATDKFIGVKDASADLVQGSAIAKQTPHHFRLISGDDPTALALLAVGGRGVISVIANAFPASFSQMIRLERMDQRDEAQKIHHQLLDLHQWLYIEGNPVGIKEACAYKQLIEPELRLPLVRMSEGNRKKLEEEMERLKDKH